MRKPKSKNCDICNIEYYFGFFGTGVKYCSRKCANEARVQQYHKRYIPTAKACQICKRDIHSVGLRKTASKYCSERCMRTANQIKSGRKFILVRIPISKIPSLFSLSK